MHLLLLLLLLLLLMLHPTIPDISTPFLFFILHQYVKAGMIHNIYREIQNSDPVTLKRSS
jgi:hypothetical protein